MRNRLLGHLPPPSLQGTRRCCCPWPGQRWFRRPACSRVTWTGPDQQVITGRLMDWPYGFNAHFDVYPRGERIDGAGGVNSLFWTSRYGAVLLSGSTAPGGPVNGVFDGIIE